MIRNGLGRRLNAGLSQGLKFKFKGRRHAECLRNIVRCRSEICGRPYLYSVKIYATCRDALHLLSPALCISGSVRKWTQEFELGQAPQRTTQDAFALKFPPTLALMDRRCPAVRSAPHTSRHARGRRVTQLTRPKDGQRKWFFHVALRKTEKPNRRTGRHTGGKRNPRQTSLILTFTNLFSGERGRFYQVIKRLVFSPQLTYGWLHFITTSLPSASPPFQSGPRDFTGIERKE